MSDDDTPTDALRLGTWARSDAAVGIVAAVTDDEVALFHPGERQVARVPRETVEVLPAGAVTVTATVDLPLAHGLGEDDVRRWVASLMDDVVRERAYAALAAEGLDEGTVLPGVRVDVAAQVSSGAVCLCGARVPAPDGAALACPSCGRQAVARPVSGPRMG